MFANKLIRFVSRHAAFLAIFILAIFIRIYFFTGMVRGDDLNYAHSAFTLANGESPFGIWAGSTRIGLYFPVAALYYVFGPSQVTTLIFPFAASLVSLLCIYLISELQIDERAAVVASLFWAVWPLDILLATDLLPDGPMAAISALAVYFWLRWRERRGRSPARALYAAGFLMVWAVLIKPLALIVFFAVVFIEGVQLFHHLYEHNEGVRRLHHRRNLGWITLGLFLTILALSQVLRTAPGNPLITFRRTALDTAEFMINGHTHIDFSDIRVTQTDLFIYLAPLIFAGFIQMLFARSARSRWIWAWFGFAIIYYEWGTINEDILIYKPITEFLEARNFLFICVPLVIIVATYLSRPLKSSTVNSMAIVGAIATMLAVPLFDDTIVTFDSTSFWRTIQGLLFLFGIFSSLIFSRSGYIIKTGTAIGGILLVAVALLKPSAPYHPLFYEDRREVLDNTNKALDYLNRVEDYPVYSSRPHALNYLSNFTLGYDWTGRGHIGGNLFDLTDLPEQECNCLIVAQYSHMDVQRDWDLLASFGDDETTSIAVYLATRHGGDAP